MFGGVASGIAAYFDIDPIIVRLALVAFGFVSGPFAVLLYLIAWAIIPAFPGVPPRKVSVWAWVALALLLAILFAGGVGPLWFGGPGFDGRGFDGRGFDGFGFWSPGFFWALILVGLGVLLFRRAETAPVPPGDAGQAPSTAAPYPPPSRPPRPPSILGRVTVAAALLIVGLAALLENLGVFDLNARRFFALLLVAVGAGLVAGAWWGRARWLIAVGAVLIPIAFVASWSPFTGPGRSFRGEFGGFRDFDDRTLRPTTLAAITDPIELHNGNLTLDLTSLPLTTDPTQVTAEVGSGRIEVLVPDDVSVDVQAEVGAGMVDIFSDARNGLGLDVRIEHPGAPDGGQLALDLTAGFGEIVVRERAAGDLQPAGPFNPFEQERR